MTKTTGGKSDPRVVEAINHAIDLNNKGQTELAVQHLSALIVEFPTAAAIRGYLAMFLHACGRFEEAIEHGRQGVLLAPKSEKASLVLHSALWSAGKRIEAIDEMKRFLAVRPSEVYSKMIEDWNLGEDVESAIEKAKRAIREDDRHPKDRDWHAGWPAQKRNTLHGMCVIEVLDELQTPSPGG